MNHRERVYNLLDGKAVDRPPTGFWLHFDKSMHHGDAAIQAHLDFMKNTGTDILKVMNENQFYCPDGKIGCTADLHKARRFSRKDKIFVDQMDIIRRIADRTGGEYPIMATIHGVLASATYSCGYGGTYPHTTYGLVVFCREQPRKMKEFFKIVSEGLLELIDCCMEAGADGIYYTTLGGEDYYFTGDEFAEFIEPYDRMLFDYVKTKTPFNVLHICKERTDLNRYRQYAPAIVNWAVHDNETGLRAGHALYPNSIILGGFDDRSGVLVDGSPQDIDAATAKLLDEMKGIPFMLGADCTLPTEISPAAIRQVAEAADRYYGLRV